MFSTQSFHSRCSNRTEVGLKERRTIWDRSKASAGNSSSRRGTSRNGCVTAGSMARHTLLHSLLLGLEKNQAKRDEKTDKQSEKTKCDFMVRKRHLILGTVNQLGRELV